MLVQLAFHNVLFLDYWKENFGKKKKKSQITLNVNLLNFIDLLL